MSKSHIRILERILDLPTAPFVEGHVAQFVRTFVSRWEQLSLRADRFGNLLVRYTPKRKRKTKGRTLLFAAHMDHPGFIAEKRIDDGRLQASWRGWVQSRYFKGERIQFFSGGRWVPATIEKVILPSPGKIGRRAVASARSFGADAAPDSVIARVKAPVAPGSPGMWNIPDATIRGNRIHARACDDLSGLAAIVCMLDVICRDNSAIPCYAFFTRAEEVGFAGALAAVEGRTLPRSTLIVAVENSKAIAGVALGDGPVLRVGDKASVFTPGATAYCQVVADKLTEGDKGFRYQRKLMDGGTCESTAYCHYGYAATGICLPLVNYHNMDTARRKIAAESIDVRDFANLVKWFVALAESPAALRFDGTHPGLHKRLESLLKEHRRRLLRTAQRH